MNTEESVPPNRFMPPYAALTHTYRGAVLLDNNPYLVEGADTQFYFTMEDQSGVPIDLTGATAQLKSKFFTKSFTIEDPTAGVISIWLGPAELSKKDYLYQADVIIFMSNGHVFKPFEQLEFYVRGGY